MLSVCQETQIMATPATPIAERFNQVSLNLEKIERELDCVSAVIDIVSNRKDYIATLTYAIVISQLETVGEYIQTPPRKCNFEVFAAKVDARLLKVEEEFIKRFSNSTLNRGFYFIEGERKSLTPGKKNELLEEFQRRLKAKINEQRKKLVITPRTNLLELQSQLRGIADEAFNTHQNLAEKQQDLEKKHTQFAKLMEADYLSLVQSKKDLLDPKSLKIEDVFTASRLDCTDYIISEVIPLNIDQVDSRGYTMLHIAAYYNRSNAVKVILEKGADPTLRGPHGYQALHWAAKVGALKCVQLLVLYGAPTIDGQGEYGRTPLHMAVYNHHLAVTQYLVEQKADINAKTTDDDEGKQTPLHDAVTRNNVDMVLLLTKYPQLNVNCRDVKGFTPVYRAFECGLTEVLLPLLQHKSWTNPEDPDDPNGIDNLLKMKTRDEKNDVKKALHIFWVGVKSKEFRKVRLTQYNRHIDRKLMKDFEKTEKKRLKSQKFPSKKERKEALVQSLETERKRLQRPLNTKLEKEVAAYQKILMSNSQETL